MLAIVWTYEPELVDRLGPLFEALMADILPAAHWIKNVVLRWLGALSDEH